MLSFVVIPYGRLQESLHVFRYDANAVILPTNMEPDTTEFVTNGALHLMQTAKNEISTVLSRRTGDSSGDYESDSGSGTGKKVTFSSNHLKCAFKLAVGSILISPAPFAPLYNLSLVANNCS